MMRRVCSLASFKARSWPFGGGEEQPLAPVGGAHPALDEVLLDQLLEHPVEALLGDAQDVEELGDGQARLAADEMQDAVMGAPEAVFVQDPVGIADEVAVGEEEQLDQVVGRRARPGYPCRIAETSKPEMRQAPSLIPNFMSALLTYLRTIVTRQAASAK